MSNDYRSTKYCPCLTDLKTKKEKVVEIIKTDYPMAVDMHSYVSQNKKPYKLAFMRAYNCKCAYCGASLQLLPKEMFEIDHFIYEKSSKFGNSKAAAGYINNLVLACHSCNHQKSSFEIPDDDCKYLYPDELEIQFTFERDDQYYIVVSNKCKSIKIVNEFYQKLNLGGEIHRLDYLLMNMLGLQRLMVHKPDTYTKLGQAIDMLHLKRNIMG